ncbi:MAG: hypothetical protein Q9217_004832 [Psora testacea]
MAAQEYIKLAQTLPPRLLRFFARYPPPSAAFSNLSQSSTASTNLNTSSSDSNATQVETATPSTDTSPAYTNPFSRTKNPITGKWHDPKFSLRRQAELVKLARANGVEDLLPSTPKGTEQRIQRRIETGLRVKGTGVGQRVKGKLWERTQKGRLEKRRVAMLGMPKLVQTWKQMGHGRGWKKWPR